MPAPHRFQMTSSQYLYLWRRRQLISAFGGHADVFANLLVAAHPDWDQALAMAMPSAVITGPECLRRAAWITQIPNRPDVAVLASSRLFATVISTSADSRRPGSSRCGPACCSATLANRARQLHPAWALADMLATEGWGACGITPDDVDGSALKRRDHTVLTQALNALGVPPLPAFAGPRGAPGVGVSYGAQARH